MFSALRTKIRASILVGALISASVPALIGCNGPIPACASSVGWTNTQKPIAESATGKTICDRAVVISSWTMTMQVDVNQDFWVVEWANWSIDFVHRPGGGAPVWSFIASHSQICLPGGTMIYRWKLTVVIPSAFPRSMTVYSNAVAISCPGRLLAR